MFGYITGMVKYVTSNHIIIDNNDIGYIIYTPNPYTYEIGGKYTVYTYQNITETENALYGFTSMEEKELFLRLISVKGLGPKTALPMFASGSVSGIVDAIDRENILYLKKFPKIGEKVARQIVLDLKGKLVLSEDAIINDTNDDVVEALKALGYKGSDITKVIPKLNKEDSVESQIKEALKLLLR